MDKPSLIFATNNQDKIREVVSYLGDTFDVITLKQANIDIDIPEPYDTIQENAFIKAKTIYNMTGNNCFSEDTGFFVDALYGKPGVKAARYAGEKATYQQNIDKMLSEMQGKANRRAYFRTCMILLVNGVQYSFEGDCFGTITEERHGTGFGYDPIFIPDGADKTFSEMDVSEKALYSHRISALKKMISFLGR